MYSLMHRSGILGPASPPPVEVALGAVVAGWPKLVCGGVEKGLTKGDPGLNPMSTTAESSSAGGSGRTPALPKSRSCRPRHWPAGCLARFSSISKANLMSETSSSPRQTALASKFEKLPDLRSEAGKEAPADHDSSIWSPSFEVVSTSALAPVRCS